MKVCVVLVGQPRSFKQCAISLRRWFETNLRPGDEVRYFPVLWNYDNTHEPARGGTITRIWDHSELREALKQSYSEEHLLDSTIVSVEDSHFYLGGLGFTPEQILYHYSDWQWFYRCRTMHQVWLFKYAVELFNQYSEHNNLEWDTVLVTRPDAVVVNEEGLNYDQLEENVKYVHAHFPEIINKLVGFSDELIMLGSTKITGTEFNDQGHYDYIHFGWLDDRFAVGTRKAVVSFFREVWKQYVDHLSRGFDGGEQEVSVYPEELWCQALICGKYSMVNIFEPQKFSTVILRNWTEKYPEFLQRIKDGTLPELIKEYNEYKSEAFHFGNEQDWIEFCKHRTPKKIKGHDKGNLI